MNTDPRDPNRRDPNRRDPNRHDLYRDDPRLARRVAERLSRSAEGVDDVTRVRLRAVRLRALEALDERPRFARPLVFSSAVAALAAVALAVVLVVPRRTIEPSPDRVLGVGLEDIDILGADEDLELYEHLEFYRWLEASEPI